MYYFQTSLPDDEGIAKLRGASDKLNTNLNIEADVAYFNREENTHVYFEIKADGKFKIGAIM